MDLTIKLENSHLNIRVVVILKTANGYLFAQNKKGWYFFPGGRVKEGENSLQAAIRETSEETGLDISKFEYVSTIENFFEGDGTVRHGKFQEINFVYKTDTIPAVDPALGLQEFTKEQMATMDIRPEIIKKLVLEDKLHEITHYIV